MAHYSQLQTVSDDLRDQAAQSVEALEPKIAELRIIVAAKRDETHSAEAILLDAERALAEARRRAGIDGPSPELRGRRLADLAIEVLRKSGKEQPLHYRDWFRLLEDGGYVITAKDPLATFLTSIARDERVERVGNRTGMYRITP